MKLLGHPLLLVLVVSAGARVAVARWLPDLSFASLPASTQVFYEVLRDRLVEYVVFTQYRPPVTYLVQGAVVAAGGPTGAYEARLFLWVTIALDIAALALLYVACTRLGVGRWVVAGVVTIFSLALIPWELWRDGAHYDHLTVPLAAAFAACLVTVLWRPSLGAAAVLGAVGAVYVGQSPAALYAVPVASVVAAALAPGQRRRRVAMIALALLIPTAVALPVIARNSAEARSFATGNQGGPAVMLFVHEATKDQPDPAALLLTGDVPSWYRWCYERPRPPAGSESDPSWNVLAQAFGICFPLTRLGEETWPFDMGALREELQRSADPQTRELIDRDIRDMRERQYLFSGFSPEQSPRWIGVYGAVSQRLAFGFFARRPDLAARTLAIAAARYVRYGPWLPVRVASDPASGGMRTQPGPLPLEAILRAAGAAYGLVATIGVITLAIGAPLGLIRLARRRAGAVARAILVLAAAAAPISGVVLLGAWDLDRYFMQVTPYVVIAAALALGSASSAGRTRRWARALVVRLVGEPGTASTFSADADPRELAAARARVLARKPALRRELAARDAEIHRAIRDWVDVPGPAFEIGSGLSPVSAPPGRRIFHSDTYAEGRAGLVASAAALPLRDGSVSAIVGVHVLHHLTDPASALREAARAVRPGGAVILLEPNHNLLSRIVFGVFHPERFDRSQREWRRDPFPDTEANQALAWIMFERDRDLFEREVPRLRLVGSRPVASVGLLLTGGYLLRQVPPDKVIDLVSRATSHPPLLDLFAIHRIIVLTVSAP